MLGLLFTLAIVPQGSNQARLHPADSLVMVEMPDVTKMMAAYEKAPMTQMLRDEQVRKSFYGALADTGFDFDEQVSEALQGMGMPETFAAAPLEGVRHYLSGVQAASFSVSLDRKGLADFAPRAARMQTIAEQLQALEAAIEGYAGASENGAAALPKELSAVGLEASALLDPWSHPYEYKPAADGSYTLRSLGSDGKPGGSGDAADIGIDDVNKAGTEFIDLLGMQCVIEFKSPTALDELRNMLAGMADKSGAESLRAGPFQMSGMQAELQEWTAPDAGLKFWQMRAQNMLVIGAGLATPEAFAARLADPALKTAAEPFYAGLAKDFGSATGATIVQGTLRMADYTDAMRSLMSEDSGDAEMFEMLEGMFPNASLRIQLVGERFITEIATKYVKPSGTVAAALGLGPLPKDLLTSVPDDAIGVYASSLDGQLLWRSIQDSMKAEGEGAEDAQAEVDKLEERYGFSIENDIFGSLGKGMLMYLLPLKGVTSIPGMALVVDVKDPAALQRGVEGLMAMLNDEAAEELKVRSKPYRDAPVWTFSFGGEPGEEVNPLMNAFSPSISIVKNRLLLTLNSTHIKKEIKRALGEETGVHVIATPAQAPPADAVSFGYMDWAALLDGAYTGGRGLLGLMGAGGPVPVDATKLPEPSVFTRFYKPTIYYSRIVPNGTYVRNESSFGPETWAGLIGIGLVGGFATSHVEEPEIIELGADESEPEDLAKPARVETKPVPAEEATKTRESMRQLATAIAVYQMDVGRYPSKLDALLVATKNYPAGFIKQGALPKDGWGRAFVYELLEGGARYRLSSTGADGVDQKGAGDDIVSP